MITPKKLHRFQALLFLAAAIITPLALILSSHGSNDGLDAAGISAAILFSLASYHWLKFKKTSEDTVLYDITKQSPAEQIRVSKRLILIMAILGPVLSYWTYHDLTSVETGVKSSVIIWAPVAMLYDNFGFWPAVLCWPLLCLILIGVSYIRIKKAKSIMESEEP